MRRIMIFFVSFLISCGCLVAQTTQSRSGAEFSVGIDLVSISYGQVLIYFEKPIHDNLSIDIALGYSPSGAWNSAFSYWYLQTDLRTYVDSQYHIGLYTEFGAAVYFADRKLNFDRWNLKPGYDTSVVFGVLGGVGYKYYLPSANGYYVDVNAFIYGLIPEPILATKSEDAAVFQYSPLNALGSVIAGYSF